MVGLAGLFLAGGPRLAWSHAADEAAPPPGAVVIAPRAEARVGQTEIVTIFTRDIFAVFLSRYADDTPITGATIEASTDLQSAKLTETDPGVYSTKELLMSPGRNDMTIKFTLGGVTHTQAIPLMMPAEAPAPTAAPPPAISTAGPLSIAGAILAVYALLSAAFLVARRGSPRAVVTRLGARVRRA
jgi:hypothetical protein